MKALNKQALRERYSPKPVPNCHICDAEMTVQRMSASRITYGCTGATYDNTGCHYAEGRSIADDHYEQSRVTVVDVSDPEVLAMLDELEAAENCIAEHRKVLNNLAAVARRYLPDYDEHPEIQAADELLESSAGLGVKGE
ncbi:TPA: ead/Ea22-like family protein [Escherichia coli]